MKKKFNSETGVNSEFKYVGSGNLESRKSNHLALLRRGKHKNKKLQNLFNIVGESNFSFEVIEYCNKTNSLIVEKYYKDLLKDSIFNVRDIVSTKKQIRRGKHSSNYKNKLSEVNTGVNNPNCRLNEIQASNIIWYRDYKKLLHREIAEMYGIAPSHVNRIGKDKWKGVKAVAPAGEMAFEIGKYYKHPTGEEMSLLCEIDTTVYGKCYVGETNRGELIPIGMGEGFADNWTEITYEEWMKNFTE